MKSSKGKIGRKVIIWMIAGFIAFSLLGQFLAGVVTYTMPKLYESKALGFLVVCMVNGIILLVRTSRLD